MKQTIHNEKTGIDYTLVGEVYLPNLVLPHGDYEIGVWGERYRDYIKCHRKAFYTSLKMQCKLDEHLREVDIRASEMYDRLLKQFAAREGITEALKAADMMQWVAAMNNINPMEISHIECNSEYKAALQLVNRNTERLKDTLTKEQLDLLLRYSESRNELSNITELDAFKSGFKLGAGLVMETIK